MNHEATADELTETQARVIRQAQRGRVEARASTFEVLERAGLVKVNWLMSTRPHGTLTDDGRAVRSILLRRAAPSVKAV